MKRPYVCRKCGEPMPNRAEMQRHEAEHNLEEGA